MDIETKDGILLRNIPDGTPDEVIKARLAVIREEKQPEASIADKIASNPITRFAIGAAKPIIGGAQLAAKVQAPFGLTGQQVAVPLAKSVIHFHHNGAQAAVRAGATGFKQCIDKR